MNEGHLDCNSPCTVTNKGVTGDRRCSGRFQGLFLPLDHQSGRQRLFRPALLRSMKITPDINFQVRHVKKMLLPLSLVVLFVISPLARGLEDSDSCSHPLGLTSHEIEDWQLAASSVLPASVDPNCAIKFARLHQRVSFSTQSIQN